MKTISRFTKSDAVLILILLLLAVAGFFIIRGMNGKTAMTVCVTVDGEMYGEYPLAVRSEHYIPGEYGGCRLEIRGGYADVTEAGCPNQICVDHAPVCDRGEAIVCLPNRIVVELK